MLQDNELYQEIADGMATYIKYKMYLMNKNTHQIQKIIIIIAKNKF